MINTTNLSSNRIKSTRAIDSLQRQVLSHSRRGDHYSRLGIALAASRRAARRVTSGVNELWAAPNARQMK
jgi:hypothetical protein